MTEPKVVYEIAELSMKQLPAVGMIFGTALDSAGDTYPDSFTLEMWCSWFCLATLTIAWMPSQYS